jgi:choline dehydrogenase-like flavoprotein
VPRLGRAEREAGTSSSAWPPYGDRLMERGRVVVVGSGPPGAAAALFLSQAGAEVLLLEAGSKRSALGLTARVRGITVLRLRRPLRTRRAVTPTVEPDTQVFEELAPGGLSNHWSCAVPRFAPDDFADAERAGEAFVWPIRYDDIAPWYDKVEPLLHIAGATRGSGQLPAGRVSHERTLPSDLGPLADEARRCGRTLTPMPYAYGAETTLTPSGTVFNSFVRLVRPELGAGRLKVRYGARVLRLDWSRSSRRVEAVVFRDVRTGSEERVPCRAVILAAGAIATPEILLSSSSAEFPEGLGNTHGVLGHYLHDHPLAKLVVDLGTPISFYPPCYLTRPDLNLTPPLFAAAGMQWSGVALLARSLLRGRPGALPWMGFNVFGTMAPTRDDWIAREGAPARPDGTPPLRIHLSHPPAAKQALEKVREDLVSVLERTGLKPRVRIWHLEPPCASVHYGGTCRMHASPQFGMLDARSRLHAVPNVVVADSAAFTTGPEKNPVLTSMALAARAAHGLAQELESGDL